MSKISELVTFAKADKTNIHKEINFATVPNFQAQEIKAETGVFVRGASKILTAHAIRHALSGHSNDAMEKERGSVGIEDTDFELIPNILNEPDRIIKGNKGRKGYESIVFIKKIHFNEYNVVMSIRKSKNDVDLVFTTMFIKNKKPMFPPA